VIASRWFAIGVATLVWTVSLWFGFLALSSERTIALTTIAVGLVFSVYTLAAFSGTADLATTGFRASATALAAGILLLGVAQITGVDSFVVVTPVVSFGVGAALALEPLPQGSGLAVRGIAVLVAAVLLALVYDVDHTVYGLVTPIVVLPMLAISDRLHDRAREVVAETPPD
jgi:hypothetical protein